MIYSIALSLLQCFPNFVVRLSCLSLCTSSHTTHYSLQQVLGSKSGIIYWFNLQRFQEIFLFNFLWKSVNWIEFAVLHLGTAFCRRFVDLQLQKARVIVSRILCAKVGVLFWCPPLMYVKVLALSHAFSHCDFLFNCGKVF